jgi:hypothetical protein
VDEEEIGDDKAENNIATTAGGTAVEVAMKGDLRDIRKMFPIPKYLRMRARLCVSVIERGFLHDFAPFRL